MKIKMTADEAIEAAEEMVRGQTYHEDSKGRTAVLIVLVEEIKRLRERLKLSHVIKVK